jgi:hypothetical protein
VVNIGKPLEFSPFPQVFPMVFPWFSHGFFSGSPGHLGGDAGAQICHGFIHVAQNLLQLTSDKKEGKDIIYI